MQVISCKAVTETVDDHTKDETELEKREMWTVATDLFSAPHLYSPHSCQSTSSPDATTEGKDQAENKETTKMDENVESDDMMAKALKKDVKSHANQSRITAGSPRGIPRWSKVCSMT